MSGTLLDLAADYEREADRLWTSQRTRWALRRSAKLLRRMVGNRAATDPAELRLTLALFLDLPDYWCRQHGYRAIAGAGGWIIQRDTEPAIIARVGDMLKWDGERITVEAAP
ncbi:hypothetical protein [Streptomyces sp. NPDC059786]|uniref:hypothetical protein n=1 Tax=Streptomyces sp. NPDC059786 TaxID=3346946 RepID=UPI003666FCED